MLHIDEESLALGALGEALADDERAHLRSCARCQAMFDQHRAVVLTGRRVEAADRPQDPGPQVWAGIAAELGLRPEVSPFGAAGAGADAGTVVHLQQFQHDRGLRRRRSWIAAAAAVAGIAVGALGATALQTQQPGGAGGQVVAQSQLQVVPAEAGGSATATPDMSGSVRIIDTDGYDYVEVDARNLPPVDGYYEVWLIRSDLSGMIALGALTSGSQGRFTIPPGTNLAQYTIVDVSVESFDGDPAHSKQSMLRGTLDV
jgi:hypothetical protein